MTANGEIFFFLEKWLKQGQQVHIGMKAQNTEDRDPKISQEYDSKVSISIGTKTRFVKKTNTQKRTPTHLSKGLIVVGLLTWPIELLLQIPTSHMGCQLHPGYSASAQLPEMHLERSRNDHHDPQVPSPPWEPGWSSWLQSGPWLAVVAIQAANQWTEDGLLSFTFFSVTLE